MVRIILFLFIALNATHSYAQRGFELGGGVGAAWYFGDINNELKLNSPGATIGVASRFNFDERICFKLGVNYVMLRGYDYKSDNLYQKARNISFNNHLAEATGQLEINFLTYRHGSRDDWYTPYMFLGGSIFTHAPRAKYEDKWRNLRELGTEGQQKGNEYSITSGSWLFGLGFKMDFSYEWSLNIEISSRQTFTDYLDDTSTKYVDNFQLTYERGEMAAALADPSILIPGFNDAKIGVDGRQRGDKDARDGYMTFSVGVMYYFGQVRCPEILKN